MPCVFRLLLPAVTHLTKRALKLKEYANHSEYSPFSVRRNFCHDLAISFLKMFRVQFIFKGLENANSKQAVYFPNHQSDFDSVLTMMLFKAQTSYLGKKQVATMPFISSVMRATDSEFLDRKDLRSEVRTIHNIANKMKANPNLSFIIFPEGQRTQDTINETMNPFKPGAFKAAYYAKADIVPMCMFGSYNFLKFNKPDKKVYPFQVTFFKPIHYEEYKDIPTTELAKKIQAQVEAELARQRELQPILETFWNRKENAKAYRKDVRRRIRQYYKERRQELKEDKKLEKEYRKTHKRSLKPTNVVTITKEDKIYFKEAKADRKQQREHFIALEKERLKAKNGH